MNRISFGFGFAWQAIKNDRPLVVAVLRDPSEFQAARCRSLVALRPLGGTIASRQSERPSVRPANWGKFRHASSRSGFEPPRVKRAE
jgi:hypothetical protein